MKKSTEKYLKNLQKRFEKNKTAEKIGDVQEYLDMLRGRNVVLVLIISLLFASCATQQRCARKFPPTTNTITNTVTETVYRDSIVFIEIEGDTVYSASDTVYVDIRTGLISSNRSYLETEHAESWCQVVDGVLLHELIQREANIERLIENAIRENSTHTETVTEVVQKVYVRGFFWWAGLISVVAVAGYIMIRFIAGL